LIDFVEPRCVRAVQVAHVACWLARAEL
jgi:hypothetical protein